VRYELARDADFRHVIHTGSVEATQDLAHSVHAEVQGLREDDEYFYRFAAGDAISPVGRTRTTPAGPVDSLHFVLASCQRWQDGYYTAYKHMAAEPDLDLVVFAGDYIYENAIGRNGGVRRKPMPDQYRAAATTLPLYRCKYGLYKLDPDLQRAHAVAPWLYVWDDHEVDDNYASQFGSEGGDPAAFLQRRAAAYQAAYEHLPLRTSSVPGGPDMQIYRSIPYGKLAEFRLLDGRQYRSDQVCGGALSRPCEELKDPTRTMLGSAQEEWLLDGLGKSNATWNVLAQQVMMCRGDRDPGPDMIVSMDNWNGYGPARQRLFDGVAERGVQNLVVLSGDAHCSVAADLRLDREDSRSPKVGAEFVGTSVSSGGDGAPTDTRGNEFLGSNDDMHFYSAQRGYVDCTVTTNEWRSDFRAMPFVSSPGGGLTTVASFVVESGQAGLQLA
jgi:alkaline phosphatase D